MSQLDELLKQSELAFAAYANLDVGEPSIDALKYIKMTDLQAEDFATKWKVVAQCPEDITGSSATVFEEIATYPDWPALLSSIKYPSATAPMPLT